MHDFCDFEPVGLFPVDILSDEIGIKAEVSGDEKGGFLNIIEFIMSFCAYPSPVVLEGLRELGICGAVEDVDGKGGVVIDEVDDGEFESDAGAFDSVESEVYLIGEEICGFIEEVYADESIDEVFDHEVAVSVGRREFTKFVEEGKGFERRHFVSEVIAEEGRKDGFHALGKFCGEGV